MTARSRARRAFLASLSRAGLGAAAWLALPPAVREALAAPGGAKPGRAEPAPDLIVRSDRPEQWETSLGALGRSSLTPNALFFVRSHFGVPQVDPSSWKLEVEGLVSRGDSFTLADLRAMPQEERVVTIECAGNGRGRMPLASTSGTQWMHGAVGNARWTGVSLGTLLDRVGASRDAKHVWLEAADEAAAPGVPKFLRSLPIAKAMDDVLLAHSMNGAPLPAIHGGPLRAIVPCWYGMASTKWLTKLTVEEKPSDNHFMTRGYRWNAPGADPGDAAPIEEMRVKSVITRPLEGARLPADRYIVQGFAWAGSAGLRIVELSVDGGVTWSPAGFMGDKHAGAWRPWATEIDLVAGSMTLMARATDGAGQVQPLEPFLSAGGYGVNAIHRVTIDVVA